jgi:copper chaperone CopZ
MSTITTLPVVGMTCGHCVAAVTEELQQLAGVTGVAVELHPGGASEVRVHSEEPVPVEALAAAIDEAGYELAS